MHYVIDEWYLMSFLILGRRQWILEDSPSVSEILEKFPPLIKYRYVSDLQQNKIICQYYDEGDESIFFFLVGARAPSHNRSF